MTQEEKQLLLKDLCARLPYNVKVHYDRIPPSGWKMSDTHVDGYLSSIEPNWSIANGYQPQIICSGTLCGIGDVKPYLRPMSSMTPEEFEEYTKLIKPVVFNKIQVNMASPESFDYLNKKMFDYRRLIEKGLAIEALKDMYN